MSERTFYRILLVGMIGLVVIGSIEYQVLWWPLLFVIWSWVLYRADLPRWDELWGGETE